MAEITNEELRNLLLKYQQFSEGSAERLRLRNEICVELYPLVQKVVGKFKRPLDKDYVNDVALTILESIEKWDPTRGGSPRGFFRVVCRNRMFDLLSKEKRERPLSMISYDAEEHEDLKDKLAVEPINSIFPDEQVLVDEVDKEAHDWAVLWILKERCYDNRGFGQLQEKLRIKYGYTHQKAQQIYEHALVSIRKQYYQKVPHPDKEKVQADLQGCKMFLRLVEHLGLTEEEIFDTIHIFGGVHFRVPKVGG